MFYIDKLLWLISEYFFKSCKNPIIFLRNLLIWEFSIYSTSILSDSPYSIIKIISKEDFYSSE